MNDYKKNIIPSDLLVITVQIQLIFVRGLCLEINYIFGSRISKKATQ